MTTPERAFHRLGRRGVLLVAFGAYAAFYGASFFSGPPYRFGHMGPFIGHLLNSHWLGWAWVLCGITAVVVALLPRYRPDALGFVALIIPSLSWVSLNSISWAVSLFTDFGEARASVAAMQWLAYAIAVMVTAGWPDPEEVPT